MGSHHIASICKACVNPSIFAIRRRYLTYIATDEGWLFLAVVIDLFSRQVVGWSLRQDMTRELVIDALRMAWFKRHPAKDTGLLFHSDRGSQYASKDFRDVLAEYGITASMSRRGDCWDNACSETLFGSLKVERLHGQRFKSRRQAKDEVMAWMLWYNRTRLQSTLAYVSPMQFEENWLAGKLGKPARSLAMGYGIQGQGQC